MSQLFYLAFALLPTATAPAAPPGFADLSAAANIRFQHQTGAGGDYYFPEITGAGAALADLTGDGLLDAYLVQSGGLSSDSPLQYDHLYRGDGRAPGQFQRVEWRHRAAAKYGMGVAAGDFDNDGQVDLYITAFGANALLRNTGDGQFVDVTDAAGVAGDGWSTSASFFDYDRDGWLDLYVANYVDFSITRNPACYSTTSRRDYCGPANFPGQQDRLYRNTGKGGFQDVTLAALAPHKPSAGLGVVAADFNNDGWQDLIVANDGAHNHLWMNDGSGRFVDDALFAGAAVNGRGIAEASMGVAVADYDEDGDEDIFLTHLMGETNTLYQNLGDAEFVDVTARAGLAAASRGYTGWATAWLDLDGDGWLDLLVTNGAVRTLTMQDQAGSDYPFRQANQAYLSQGGQRFVELSGQAMAALAVQHSTRGAAFGDIDNDGDTDVLINNGNGPAQLLVMAGKADHWVGIRLLTPAGRDALGARVTATLSRGRRLHRRVAADGSYASASDPRLLIRYPAGDGIQHLDVRWPDGRSSRHEASESGAYITIRQNHD